jgi:Kef-type K+ transport system membrane component KefB
VLGWARVDAAVGVLALLGLAYVLLLAGLEVDVDGLRGGPLRRTGAGFLLSLGLGLLAGFALAAAGAVASPLLVAVVLASTGLAVVIPLLKDAGETRSPFGQLVIAGASVAEFGTIVLLSLLLSREATGTGARVALLAGLGVAVVAVVLALRRVERSRRLAPELRRLQDSSAQIRVRGAALLLVAFAALAEGLGVEVILGAFLAGVALRAVDRDERMLHPQFRTKLEAVGFGVFAPVFYVASGLRFDLRALVARPGALALVPVFLAALLVVRGLPAGLYRPVVGTRRAAAARAASRATALGFVVVGAQLGAELGLLSPSTAAALVGAGLLSVLLFPLTALVLLREAGQAAGRPAPAPAAPVLTHTTRVTGGSHV